MTNPFVDLSGGVTRLNAQDGLFLRAQHLNEMEDYAKALATLAARGGGPGVVYGYDLTLTASTLQVTPGLAIDHNGMPLVSDAVGTLDLSHLSPAGNTYWRIELVPGTAVASGDENVYGSACDDACNGGTIRSNLTEGARVQLSPVVLGGLDGQLVMDQRNWLASQYFEAERTGSGPWLRSAERLDDHPWQTGTPQPTDQNVVPLGVVWRGTGGLQLDQWIARRELVEAPARRLWQSRLGMRPDSVFLAQICQFQAQLAGVVATAVPASSIAEVVQWLGAARDGVTRHDETAPVELLTSAISALSGPAPADAGPLTLVDQGINELPPAGYLPLTASDTGVEQTVRNLFGKSAVELGFTYCSPDFVAEHVQRAQHRDRISLPDPVPVEVFVPEGGDLGWVAFTRGSRRSSRDTSSGGDVVPVYHTTAGSGVSPSQAATGVVGSLVRPIGTARFPVNAWASPEAGVYQSVQQIIRDTRTDQNMEITVVGVARSEDRLPLAAARATLLGTSFTPNPQMPEIHAVLGPVEAIVVVVSATAPSGTA
ncbi:hypothetical protein [Kutzneria sp. CA-103260]|uniref:hypothetical protein n=1 Tax=Kutzneria sp. CA-103260 TaxID=2802641 RepID=UPI001BA6AE43|nr:hypothetical protein [Kutzneria sp. CA-103260]QUQ63891.1 hypothetical protein JJ691_16080 [Kutzneria sp. CA-103260]